MSHPVHIVVLAGSTSSVRTELASHLPRKHAQLVAPLANAGLLAADAAYRSTIMREAALALQMLSQRGLDARISFWYYESMIEAPNDDTMPLFFPAGFGISIPDSLYGQPDKTRDYILARLEAVGRYIYFTEAEILRKPNSSPFLLPVRNFRSKLLCSILNSYRAMVEAKVTLAVEPGRSLYQGEEQKELQLWLKRRRQSFEQSHPWRSREDSANGQRCFHDDRKYAFEPAQPSEQHGHSVNDDYDVCYINGRFRFGAAISPKFHYDVYPSTGSVQGVFFHCNGTSEELPNRRYRYLNIYPNDHFVPKQGS
jgi:hypothetical protein